MLTRETALERLRSAGTLATFKRPGNAINTAEANTPRVNAIVAVVDATRACTGPRHLAPAAGQMVLP
jgi:hypothetical protein